MCIRDSYGNTFSVGNITNAQQAVSTGDALYLQVPGTVAVSYTHLDTDVPLTPVENQDTEEQELNAPTQPTQQPSDTEGFEQVSLYETFPLMYAQLEAIGTSSVSSDASQVVESETIVTDVASSSTALASSLNTDHPSFEVEYSIDGSTWNTVGHVQ